MSILNTTADILKLMSQLKRSITASDLITQLHMPKSTASRVLKQLCEAGFLQRDPESASYQTGLLLIEAAYLAHRVSSLTDDIEQALRSLCQRTGHTGYLSVLDGDEVLVLRVIPGRHALRVITYPGTRSPAWETSTGRALLSRFSDEHLAAHYPTPHTKTSLDVTAQLARIHTIRQHRWSHAVDEAVPGTASVSCSVHNPQTKESIAFCLTFPSSMADQQEILLLAQQLYQAAMPIGKKYGDPYWLG